MGFNGLMDLSYAGGKYYGKVSKNLRNMELSAV